jgi:hypothetical protein
MKRLVLAALALAAISIASVAALATSGVAKADVSGCTTLPNPSPAYLGMTAAAINPDSTLSGTVDATGCDIGVYYGPGSHPSLNGVTIKNARQFGVVNDGGTVNVMNSPIQNIGDSPFDGMQYGIGIVYDNGSGTISGNHVGPYQKNGIVVRGGGSATVQNNVVTGSTPVNYIAQNGIEVYGATATVTGNTVTGNWYTGSSWTACGLLFYNANGVKQSANTMSGNQMNLCNVGRGGGNVKP